MRTKLVTLFSIILLLISTFIGLIYSSAIAEDYVFGTNIEINDDIGSSAQKAPDITVDNSGNIYAVWSDERSSSNPDIYLSKSTDDGKLFGDDEPNNDIRVDGDTSGASQKEPAIATSGSNIYVVWVDDRSLIYHIYFAKSTNGGTTFFAHKQVDSLPSETRCDYPDIAVTSSGTICVVWQATFNNNADIYYAESTNGGNSFETSVRVDNSGVALTQQKYPKIAVGDSGDRYIVWQDNRSGGVNLDIYFTTALSSSNFQTNELRVDEDSTNSEQSRPSIAAYGNSNVYIAWKDERAVSTVAGDIYFDKSTDKGVSFGTDKMVNDGGAGSPVQDRPDVAVDSDGAIHIAWEDKRSGSVKKIYYSNSTDGGGTFSTNLRVDDSGSQSVEHTEPTIAATGSGKVFVAWKDNRNDASDIYFSKWGLASQMGYPPELIDADISKDVAGPGTEFTYYITYKDPDDEGPAAGFPKVYIYTDHSKTTQLPGSPFTMSAKYGQDGLFTNGEIYTYKKTLSDEEDYAYMFEAKAAIGDQSLVQSSLFLGPTIDVDPPIFFNPEPLSTIWLRDPEEVKCNITISDQGGTGVDQSKISYQYKLNSSAEFTRFYSNAKILPIDGDNVLCSATITLKEGKNNYIRWNATDLASSGELGYVLSDIYEINVDTEGVTFANPVPPEINIQSSKSVTCSIDINDFGGSGVNGSSVKYYYKISGYAKFEGPYSAAIENYGESITATTPIPLQLDNGDDNAIKWIVDDMAGNVMASEEFVIRVDDQRKPNTPPDPPTGIKPTDTKDSTPMITWSAGNDKEGDTLEFSIQIGTYYDGDDILSWTNVGTNTQYLVPENNSLVVGTYYVQLRAFDSLDYSAVYQSMMNITATGNSPPSAPNAIYSNVTSEHRPEITWTGASDPDGDPLRYRIQIGTRPGIDDILSHSDIGNEILLKESYTPNSALEDGIYYIQIIALDGFSGSSAPHEEMLKIASFRPEITVQNTLTIKKGETLATFEINLKNNCSMHDNITLSLSGELTTKSSVTLTFKPTAAPILVDPYKTEKINLKIEVPEEMSVGSYKVVIQATSEDGLTTSFEHELTLIVTSDGKPTDGNDGGGDGDDDGSTSGFGAMFPIIIIIIIIVIVVVIIGVVAASASKKKREKAEKDKFFNSSNDYEKLYGPKKEY